MSHPEQAPFVIICINVMLVVICQNHVVLDAVQQKQDPLYPEVYNPLELGLKCSDFIPKNKPE